MATKIDKARRFANDFVFKHDFGLSEEGAELFADANEVHNAAKNHCGANPQD